MPLSLLAEICQKLSRIRREGVKDQHALDSWNAQSGHRVLMRGPYFVTLGLGATRNSLQVGCSKRVDDVGDWAQECEACEPGLQRNKCIHGRQDKRWRPQELRLFFLRLDSYVRWAMKKM
jgi:hypothetical protein